MLPLAHLPLDALLLITEHLECVHLAFLIATGDKTLTNKLVKGGVRSLYIIVEHGRLPAWPRNLVKLFRSITSFTLIGSENHAPHGMYTEEDLLSLPTTLRHLHIEEPHYANSVLRPSLSPNAISWRAGTSTLSTPPPFWKYFDYSSNFPSLESLKLSIWRRGVDDNLHFVKSLSPTITSLDIANAPETTLEGLFALPTSLTRLGVHTQSVDCVAEALPRFTRLEHLKIFTPPDQLTDEFVRNLRPEMKTLILDQPSKGTIYRIEALPPLPPSLTHLDICVQALSSQGIASLPRGLLYLALTHWENNHFEFPFDAASWPPHLTTLKWDQTNSGGSRYDLDPSWIDSLPRSITRIDKLPNNFALSKPILLPKGLQRLNTPIFLMEEDNLNESDDIPSEAAITSKCDALSSLAEINCALGLSKVYPHLQAVKKISVHNLAASDILAHFSSLNNLTSLTTKRIDKLDDITIQALPRGLLSLEIQDIPEIGSSRFLPPLLTHLALTVLKCSPVDKFIEDLPKGLLLLHLGSAADLTRDSLKSLPSHLRSIWLGDFTTEIHDEDIATLPRTLITLSLPETGQELTCSSTKLLPPFLQSLHIGVTSWTNDCIIDLPQSLSLIMLPSAHKLTEGLEAFLPPFVTLLSIGDFPTSFLPANPNAESRILFLTHPPSQADEE